MPTRHLSDEQRHRYANFAVAPSLDQLAQYFHLDRSDREVILHYVDDAAFRRRILTQLNHTELGQN